jgi:hypothetical protein
MTRGLTVRFTDAGSTLTQPSRPAAGEDCVSSFGVACSHGVPHLGHEMSGCWGDTDGTRPMTSRRDRLPRARIAVVAQRVEILLTDDLNGGEASQTVRFALDGRDLEIDLNDNPPRNFARPSSPTSQPAADSERVPGQRDGPRSRRAPPA